MRISLKLVLLIIAEILKLIAANVPEAEAFTGMDSKFGVSEDLLRKFF